MIISGIKQAFRQSNLKLSCSVKAEHQESDGDPTPLDLGPSDKDVDFY
jgi:hypothetical protein